MGTENLGVSIIFATHNGAITLPTTLESFTHLDSPRGGWNIIAVDNASTDNTSAILHSFADTLPLTILYQPKRGKNAALNTAIPHIKGDLIVFTDDDVVAQSDWLTRFQEVSKEQPDYAIFGGKVVPRWPSTPPEWLLDEVSLGFTFALTPIGREDGPIRYGEIVGPNMCIRRDILEAGLQFNENVGPASGNYTMGSEVDFNRRATAAGYLSWYTSSAVVGHQIREHQMDPKWIVQRAYRGGRGEAHFHLSKQEPFRLFSNRRIIGVPYWRYRSLAESWIKARWYAVIQNKSKWFHNAFDANWHSGYIKHWVYAAFRSYRTRLRTENRS